MGCFADRDYVHAKVYALHGYLLSEKDYAEMLGTGNVQGAAPGIPPGMLHDDFLKAKEYVFRQQIRVVVDLYGASRFYQELLLSFLRCYEIRNLKLALTGAAGQDVHIRQWYDISPHQSLERDVLNQEITMEVMRTLTHTSYLASIVSSRDDLSPADALMDADRFLLRYIFLVPGRIPSTLRGDIFTICAGAAAYIRITWRERLKRYYDMNDGASGEYMRKFLEPAGGFGIAEEQVKKWEKIMEGILKRSLPAADGEAGSDLSLFERELEYVLWSRVGKFFYRQYHSVNPVICYLILLHFQIKNIFAVMEGIRFNYPRDELRKRIICGV
ncbi:MAG: hypothetical protein CVV44_11470 [Spirochaetae bacterium HGW-Spirochaetae-1]|jgi:hypothetical protein|nr:MAG: hypothetical protein CVV44_11470 [Spirochaetae bacterium HGW-Spirochaetae-1]